MRTSRAAHPTSHEMHCTHTGDTSCEMFKKANPRQGLSITSAAGRNRAETAVSGRAGGGRWRSVAWQELRLGACAQQTRAPLSRTSEPAQAHRVGQERGNAPPGGPVRRLPKPRSHTDAARAAVCMAAHTPCRAQPDARLQAPLTRLVLLLWRRHGACGWRLLAACGSSLSRRQPHAIALRPPAARPRTPALCPRRPGAGAVTTPPPQPSGPIEASTVCIGLRSSPSSCTVAPPIPPSSS